jgi:hypothetical protein
MARSVAATSTASPPAARYAQFTEAVEQIAIWAMTLAALERITPGIPDKQIPMNHERSLIARFPCAGQATGPHAMLRSSQYRQHAYRLGLTGHQRDSALILDV